jgi:hypothetical protein
MSDNPLSTAAIGLPEHQEAHRAIAALITKAFDIAADLPHITDSEGRETCPIAMSACVLQLDTPTDDGVTVHSGVVALGRGDQMAEMIAKQLARMPMSVARSAVTMSMAMREELADERKDKQEEN